jgi:hypothetical protein
VSADPAREDRDRPWQHPWLRINLLLLNMAKQFGVREPPPVLKGQLKQAIAIREKLRRSAWWN